MDIKTITETYKRYLKTFNDKDSNLFVNYGKIKNFIDTNCEDGELRSLLWRDSIGRSVREIRKREIKVRDRCTLGWSTDVTKEAYQLIKNIKRHENDYDLATYAVNFYKFARLADGQNPYLELYLWYCFDNADGVGRLLKVSMEEIEEAAANAVKPEEESGTENETESETEN